MDDERLNPISTEAAIAFLAEAADYFSHRPTKGEDRAHWANVYNAENCQRIVALLKSAPPHPVSHSPKGGEHG